MREFYEIERNPPICVAFNHLKTSRSIPQKSKQHESDRIVNQAIGTKNGTLNWARRLIPTVNDVCSAIAKRAEDAGIPRARAVRIDSTKTHDSDIKPRVPAAMVAPT